MSANTERRGGYRDGNSTADRALTILMMFSDERRQISANDIAEHLNASRSTAYRYAQTLVNSEFLTEDPGSGFMLGPKVMELARIARHSHGMSDIALPIMRTLAAEFRDTVLLTRRVGPAILCTEREEWPGQYIRLSYERGSRLPLNAGASAYILLAWMPEDLVRTLLAAEDLRTYTPNSLTNHDAIIDRLRQIRADGYCIAQGEVDPDVIGIAAPIFDASGDVHAGLSMVTLATRLSKRDIETTRRRLVDAAQQVTDLFVAFS
jgi:DNA-binding IclR family transcriptional regulator